MWRPREGCSSPDPPPSTSPGIGQVHLRSGATTCRFLPKGFKKWDVGWENDKERLQDLSAPQREASFAAGKPLHQEETKMHSIPSTKQWYFGLTENISYMNIKH